MKKIIFTLILVMCAMGLFASVQNKTNQDKPSLIYEFSGSVHDKDSLSSQQQYYTSPYEDDDLSLTTGGTTISQTDVTWFYGQGGGGTEAGSSTGFGIGPWADYNDTGASSIAIALDENGVGFEAGFTSWSHIDWLGGYTNSSTNGVFYDVGTWDYFSSEYCDVTDGYPPPQNWEGYEATSDGPLLVQNTATETYRRTAQAVWHVQTGGKSIAGRKSVWQFTAGASVSQDARGTSWYEFTNLTQITLGELGTLKSDGNLWALLPDGVDKDITPDVGANDYYTFNESGLKYSLSIFVNTTTTNANLSTDTPICSVGQKINLEAIWSPPLPDGVQKSSVSQDYPGLWLLGGQYVNNFFYPDDCTNCSLIYTNDPNYLTNEFAQVWWISGDYDNPQTCDANFYENLTFPNGQSLVAVAYGKLKMFAPSVSFFSNPPFIPMLTTNQFGRRVLGLGDHSEEFYGNYFMDFSGVIQSKPPFLGDVGWTQLVNRYISANPAWGTYGQIMLDNVEFAEGTVSFASNITTNKFTDGPSTGGFSNVTASDNFTTYLRFRPTPDGIFVTLGSVVWGWSATTSNGVISASSVTGPSFTKSTQIPVWNNAIFNGGGY